MRVGTWEWINLANSQSEFCYVILGQYFTKLPFKEQQRQLVSLVGIGMLYYNRVTRIIYYLLSHHQSLYLLSWCLLSFTLSQSKSRGRGSSLSTVWLIGTNWQWWIMFDILTSKGIGGDMGGGQSLMMFSNLFIWSLSLGQRSSALVKIIQILI